MEPQISWLTYIVLSAAETWIGYRLFNTYLSRNNIRSSYYRLGIFCYFAFQMLSYAAQSPMFSTAAYYFIFAAAIAIIFFNDSLQNKLTIAMLFVIMNYASKCAVTALGLAWGLQSLPLPPDNYRLIMDPWAQMASCLLFMLLLGGTICIRRLRLNKQNLLYSALSFVFPIVIMLLAVLISRQPFYSAAVISVTNFYIYTTMALFAAAISLFYLLEKNILLDMSNEKSSIMEALLSLQRSHYERMEISQRETRALRHDIKKHVQCLYTLLENGHAQKAQSYLRELYTANKHLRSVAYSGNIVIDSILSNGFATAEENGIDVKCSVVLPPSLNIAEVDLCILFGNLVENAVEACQRITDPQARKSIVLNVSIKKDYLFIDITNTFSGRLNKQHNIYKTVKTDKRYCGIGLLNIEKIVEKYNGELAISHSGTFFNVSIMLSLLPAA